MGTAVAIAKVSAAAAAVVATIAVVVGKAYPTVIEGIAGALGMVAGASGKCTATRPGGGW